MNFFDNIITAIGRTTTFSGTPAFLYQLESVFSDSWFNEDQLGACYAAALQPVPDDPAPHVPSFLAEAALHDHRDVATDGLSLEASTTRPGTWCAPRLPLIEARGR